MSIRRTSTTTPHVSEYINSPSGPEVSRAFLQTPLQTPLPAPLQTPLQDPLQAVLAAKDEEIQALQAQLVSERAARAELAAENQVLANSLRELKAQKQKLSAAVNATIQQLAAVGTEFRYGEGKADLSKRSPKASQLFSRDPRLHRIAKGKVKLLGEAVDKLSKDARYFFAGSQAKTGEPAQGF